jgi:hypothetical protein
MNTPGSRLESLGEAIFLTFGDEYTGESIRSLGEAMFLTFLGKALDTCSQSIGAEAELPSGYWQKCGNFLSFSLKHCVVFVYSDEKSRELWKLLVVLLLFFLFSTIPLLARLKLVHTLFNRIS